MVTIFDAIKFGENELKDFSDTSKLDAKVLLKDVLKIGRASCRERV